MTSEGQIRCLDDQARRHGQGAGGVTADFYDQLAPYYHLIFEDWQASIDRQGSWLDSFIRAEWPSTRSVLDAAAGIGTQALGLAARGYRVTASDISSGAVERARKEAELRGLQITAVTADLRVLSKTHSEHDLVIACDNSLPHLLSDTEISQALRECYRCVRPGGGCLFSVRDYGDPGTGSELHPYGIRRTGENRVILFQVWEWDGPCYDLSFYVIDDRPDAPPSARVFRSRYYAIPPDHLLELMRTAGFEKVRRVEGFYQPVLVGTRPGAG
jgi:SAM-dependent methyltransferase